ncbi:MAG: response regulator [Planctomycetia bacterium]|nr:response regulator [Planctomycetia bacterium]
MTSQATYIQKCPICGRRLRVQVRYLGMTLTCQHCQGRFVAKDTSSIWDNEVDLEDGRVEKALHTLEDDLQKSGIFSHAGSH